MPKFFMRLTTCYKTLIYCHSTVTPSFCVIKQCYDSNYHGTAVSNTLVIYLGISTLEITGIFITLAENYHGIWTLEKAGFFTVVINYSSILIKLAPGHELGACTLKCLLSLSIQKS
jgi:hypothetical protein